MIEVKNKRDCCGCSACAQKCPKHCISLLEDEEGFLYPKVDNKVCIDCGICEGVCPFANIAEPIVPLSVLAAMNRNEEERMRSSSGGVFISFAREVLKEGGVVFGVSFNNSWGTKFCYAEAMEDVYPMMGSKYVQAEMGDAYNRAESFLKEGRIVLFMGCPCQIAGLHRFLKKKYDNLISVDCLCHGIPSPGVWRKFLEETLTNTLYGTSVGKRMDTSSPAKEEPVISSISFRDKQISGWRKYNLVVYGKFTSITEKNDVLFSVDNINNPFMKGFISDIYIRPSCYACKCKKGRSHSDITIGDFWGIWNSMPDFDDDKGVSLVLINTKKGQDFLNRLDIETRITSIEDATRSNDGFTEDRKEHPKRKLFFDLYNNGTSIYGALSICLYVPIQIRALRSIKHRIKRIARRLRRRN